MNFFRSDPTRGTSASRALWLMVSAFAALAIHSAAHAEIAANVNFVSGLVTATGPAAGSRELAKGNDIHSRDTIDTAQNGRIQMRFTDGGLVSLMPGTTFSVDEYLFEGRTEEEGSLVFGMLRGGLRTVTGSIGKVQHDQYELKTPVATLGIRGTEYVAVLNPPNTLRVHVGRGKVVITNDHGSLEVPEGRNAVVTLGEAPQFSEEGPQYLATSPTGEGLLAQGEVRQDPYALDPLGGGLLLAKGTQDFIGLPLTPVEPVDPAPVDPDPIDPGPVDPEPVDPDPVDPEPSDPGPVDPGAGPGTGPTDPELPLAGLPSGPYLMTGFLWDESSALSSWSLSTPTDLVFADESIVPSEIDASGFDLGTLKFADTGSSGALSWGFFTDGDGSLNGMPISLSGGNPASGEGQQYLPYVLGSAPEMVPATISYMLEAGTPARSNWEQGTLEKLDFSINFNGTPTYTLDMKVVMDHTGEYTLSQSAATQSQYTGGPSGFVLHDVQCVGCGVNGSASRPVLEGFLSGSGAEQAGMVYHFMDQGNDAVISGAAGLQIKP